MSTPALTKFGYPGTAIHEDQSWIALVPPGEATPASMALTSHRPVQRFGGLDADGLRARIPMLRPIEPVPAIRISYQELDDLHLMMAAPYVHFEITPRYPDRCRFTAMTFPDTGRLGLPNLGTANAPGTEVGTALVETLRPRQADASA